MSQELYFYATTTHPHPKLESPRLVFYPSWLFFSSLGSEVILALEFGCAIEVTLQCKSNTQAGRVQKHLF